MRLTASGFRVNFPEPFCPPSTIDAYHGLTTSGAHWQQMLALGVSSSSLTTACKLWQTHEKDHKARSTELARGLLN